MVVIYVKISVMARILEDVVLLLLLLLLLVVLVVLRCVGVGVGEM